MANCIVTVPGLTMGTGTSYDIVSIKGLSKPGEKRVTVPKLAADGDWAGTVKLTSRTIIIAVEIVGTPGSDLTNKIDAMEAAWASANSELLLTYEVLGWPTKRVMGYPGRCEWDVDLAADAGLVSVVLEWYAANPNVTTSAGPAAPSGLTATAA